MLKALAVEDLPRNAFFGDGTAISTEDLEAIRTAYRFNEVEFRWQAGDIVIVDNLLSLHRRKALKGQRRVLVAMA